MTPKQLECLDAIKRLTVRGVPPTLAEIGEAIHVASKSSTHRLLTGLRERGLIEWMPARPRSIRVVDDPWGRLDRMATSDPAALRIRIDTIISERHPGWDRRSSAQGERT